MDRGLAPNKDSMEKKEQLIQILMELDERQVEVPEATDLILALFDVNNRRELLIALAKDFKENFISCDRIDPEKYVDDYLSNL